MYHSPCSLIIATNHPADSLEELAHALQRQSFPLDDVEIRWVPRESMASVTAKDASPTPPKRQRLAAPIGGIGAAWNKGAAAGHGQIVIFLQDNLIPTVSWLAAHIKAHQDNAERLVFGPERRTLPRQPSLSQIEMRRQDEARYHELRQPGHRYMYRDISPGSMSMPATVWQRLGGFDPQLSSRNAAYDLALRMLNAGGELHYSEAAGVEYEAGISDDPALAWWEGRDDAILTGRYPQLRSSLLTVDLAAPAQKVGTLLRRLALVHPTLGDGVALRLQGLLGPLEYLRQRRYWLTLYRMLGAYWYWRGMTNTLGKTKQPVPSSIVVDELKCDLSQGITVVAHLLDQQRPVACHLYYYGQSVGRIAPLAGAERLRGRHLYAALTGELSAPFLTAVTARPPHNRHPLANALSCVQQQLIPGDVDATSEQ